MNDLDAPLRRRKLRGAAAGLVRPLRRFPVTRVVIACLLLLAAVLVWRLAFVEDPHGGRPSATTEIAAAPPNEVAKSVLPEGAQVDPGTVPADGTAGTTTDATDAADPATADAQALGSAIEPDLVEETAFGPIPRMSGSGRTPFEAYRQEPDAAAGDGKVRVAIVVSGLGISSSGTLDAIEKLPPGVTMGFAPYGKDLERTVNAARQGGHEVILEVPLEPFDYPDNDPGPDTLLTGQPPRENLNRLYRVMSRFEGYIGVMNNMGARFTSSGADLAPIMEELGARGLGYIDDGSSNRSLAEQFATANRVPFAKVGMTLDATPSRSAILAGLDQLVTAARSNGEAIGLVSALPVSIETITEWSAGLADQNIEIVPVSALMSAQASKDQP